MQGIVHVQFRCSGGAKFSEGAGLLLGSIQVSCKMWYTCRLGARCSLGAGAC